VSRLLLSILLLITGCNFSVHEICYFDIEDDENCRQDNMVSIVYASYDEILDSISCNEYELDITVGVCDDGCILFVESTSNLGRTTQYYDSRTKGFIGLTSVAFDVGDGDICPDGTYWPYKIECAGRKITQIVCRLQQ
jgi:hypothetical protein